MVEIPLKKGAELDGMKIRVELSRSLMIEKPITKGSNVIGKFGRGDTPW